MGKPNLRAVIDIFGEDVIVTGTIREIGIVHDYIPSETVAQSRTIKAVIQEHSSSSLENSDVDLINSTLLLHTKERILWTDIITWKYENYRVKDLKDYEYHWEAILCK